ncbi:hypothetical protein RJT34_07636 [Clitoria ternatea]|uniref:Peptidase A1 domain-containing protein n=1 Tax=Clitoria ternatea TaxID=43366 RepID=A0AAN9K4V7_CLITE
MSFPVLLLNVIICTLVLYPTASVQAKVLVAPVSKDKATNLFTISVFFETTLRPTKLYLDLGFRFPWTFCDADNFNSNASSAHRIPCDPTFCRNVGVGSLTCNNCSANFPDQSDPFCVCGAFPENPVTIKTSLNDVFVDTLALPTTEGSLALIPNYTFSCSKPYIHIGLPKMATGLATVARSKLSFQSQISAALNSPNCSAICFPTSSQATGVAFFGSTGPYHAFPPNSSKIDVSKSLVFTPLVINPKSNGDTDVLFNDFPPSFRYFIGLTSIRINNKPVPVDQTLLTIDKKTGNGGTCLSTATPFTLLESSIYKAFTELFVKEAASPAFNLTPLTTPVKNFNVCYPAQDLTVTRVGPLVPAIDLVLHSRDVVWRISGANSMVRVTNKEKNVNLWCLGFLDGGVDNNTPIVIGGKQLEDNLLQFDLENDRLGFTSSLLPHSLSCDDFKVKDFANH